MTVSSDYTPPDTPLDVLHDDAQMIVVNKPAGLLSVPGRGEHLADCLLVHRLDRDTSGVMVFAMTPHAQRHLGQQFEKRLARKAYVARLAGLLEPKTGTVDLPLIVDWENRPRQMVDHENGKAAVTDWRVLRHDGETTRLRLYPKTGRSHQLRVHMLSLGHPILGDPFYATGPALVYPRLMLHSESLAFRHPDGGAGTKISAKAPF